MINPAEWEEFLHILRRDYGIEGEASRARCAMERIRQRRDFDRMVNESPRMAANYVYDSIHEHEAEAQASTEIFPNGLILIDGAIQVVVTDQDRWNVWLGIGDSSYRLSKRLLVGRWSPC